MEKQVLKYGDIEYVWIFHPDKKSFQAKTLMIDGATIIEYPAYYVRQYENKTKGLTTEVSLKPFKNEKSARV